MKKVVTILGARPQFIKASVVSSSFQRSLALEEVIIHTGQHFDPNMSNIFFDELGMPPPAHQLSIHGGGHGEMTGRMLIELERLLFLERPDAVLVYGDTNSTLAGALAAVKLHIPVAHVEAGLRSFNVKMPEEINRIVTDRVSRWLFAPTASAIQHLRNEGFNETQYEMVGDVMLDVARHHGARVSDSGGCMSRFGLVSKRFILATVHRAENTNDPERLMAIVGALSVISNEMPVVWPLHPRTRAKLEMQGNLKSHLDSLCLVPPLGYLDMVQLEKNSALIATDSGGVQKEAFFFKTPCVTLRDETEWIELVEAGWNTLAPPTSSERVLDALHAALGSSGLEVMPYGEGDAAVKIVNRLENDLCA